MKKIILFAIIALMPAIKCFSQQIPCKAVACPPSDTVYLCYDTCAKKIIRQSKFGLSGKKTYIFQINNVNSALVTTKILASDISRSVTFPAGFILPNGSNTIGKTQSHQFTEALTGVTNYSNSVTNYYFFQRYNFDYNILQYIASNTHNLAKQLNSYPLEAKLLKVHSNSVIDSIEAKIKQLSTAITLNASDFEKLRNKVKTDTDKNDADQLKTTIKIHEVQDAAYQQLAKLNLHDLDSFTAFVNSTVADYMSRVDIIINTNYNNLTISMEQLNQINANDKLLGPELPFIKQSPAIINSIINSTPYINSSAYRITEDYLQLNISLLKPKFSDKPDTISTNKLNFYKIHYWKWLDISAGFFYDDLTSASYYFKNSIPAKEIKSNADISVGALAHSYYVFGAGFKAGPCLGAGVSLLDGKSKYFAGGSAIIGRSNEWAFSFGYALADLPQPSNLYNTINYTTTTTTNTSSNGTASTTTTGSTPSNGTTTTTTTTSSITSTTQPIGTTGAVTTYNRYRGGIFIGITYSFLKL